MHCGGPWTPTMRFKPCSCCFSTAATAASHSMYLAGCAFGLYIASNLSLSGEAALPLHAPGPARQCAECFAPQSARPRHQPPPKRLHLLRCLRHQHTKHLTGQPSDLVLEVCSSANLADFLLSRSSVTPEAGRRDRPTTPAGSCTNTLGMGTSQRPRWPWGGQSAPSLPP